MISKYNKKMAHPNTGRSRSDKLHGFKRMRCGFERAFSIMALSAIADAV